VLYAYARTAARNPGLYRGLKGIQSVPAHRPRALWNVNKSSTEFLKEDVL
jgi:hypothetical protein